MSRRTTLNVTELEPRTNPAKFTVSTLSPLTGDEGDTAATHTGTLIQTSAVVVEGVDVTAAVKAAYSGGITVSLGGQTTTYVFDSTAGGSGSAYSIEVDGEQVRIGFEDMAGQTGCDYDYNDREWLLMVRQTGQATVAYTGTFLWSDTITQTQTATVTAGPTHLELLTV